ncbi:GTPase IMAP family member 7 [Holothuria leucospilota]|uniref:GTPase IMAP family member 7 n=1 Tax=Holothuria leucospilota TaxID=206669 RepID=A0A9Q1BBJ3_HOLLE|nr:GTPase IMAP family member 7 [Holothuria leucospilota]
MKLFSTVLLLLKTLVCLSDGIVEEGCSSVQYLELGKSGTIQCSFQEDYFALFWHNSTDVTMVPILVLKDSVKSGAGYLSGDFDVHSNGSLIIHNVSLEHEHSFAVLKFDSNVDDPDVHVVSLQTFLEPKKPYPLVSECGNQRKVCFLPTESSPVLNCLVVSSRPVIDLVWKVRTYLGDWEISSEKNVVDGPAEYCFTSRATTRNAFIYTHVISFLVCEAAGLEEVIEMDETEVLLLNNDFNFSSVSSHPLYFQNREEIVLKCGMFHGGHSYIVWMRIVNDEHHYLLYSVNVEEKFTSTYGNGYHLGDEGTLTVPLSGIQHDGLYYCIYGNGETERVEAIDVTIYVRRRRKMASDSQGAQMDKEEGIPLRIEERKKMKEKGTSVSHEHTVTHIAQDYFLTLSHQYSLAAGIEERAEKLARDKYTLRENQSSPSNAETDDLTIVILGKTGVGKSATANSILGEMVFVEDLHTEPVTLKPQRETRKINGREISVIDTPGLEDTSFNLCKINKEVEEIMKLSSPGIDAFIYVLSIAAPRLTEEDLKTVLNLEREFGANMEKYWILVYSHAELLEKKMDLNQFLHERKNAGDKTSSFFKRFNTKVVAVNNSSPIRTEKERNQTSIIALIDYQKTQNNNICFATKLSI